MKTTKKIRVKVSHSGGFHIVEARDLADALKLTAKRLSYGYGVGSKIAFEILD